MSTSNVLRPGGRSRPGRLVALLTVTTVAAFLLSAPSGSAPASASPAPATASGVAGLPAGAEPVAVTLITGDIVYWQDAGDGNPRVEVEPALRDYPVEFDQSGTQEDFYVIPTDAMEHVVAGTVDEELFNIPGLIRQGFDDATTDELPVIVTFNHDRSRQQLTHDADVLPATGNVTAVEGVNGAGVTVDRGKADAFRRAVFGTPGQDGSTRTAGARGLDGAVKQVLLDQVLEIDLAESVPQIGAPQAWDAGYTGEGVTVAVLDTGIDSSHPDLAGQVVAAENFTDEPDATDTHGHGTHVASTIAGTGTASDGARRGVAPGADLLSGKVCRPTLDGRGVCQTSWVMAGMEWATHQGADVVNMSLGSDPTDGTDPLSQLVNKLSAEKDVLFVTSAGNRGCQGQQIGAPGAADAALAVGAVEKNDNHASFSSCGPRLEDYAVKPEITAPGVGIIAARAEGSGAGSPVDDRYTSLDGTSMASPHVAGTAALLAQARPGISWRALKDSLVSTATDGGHLWFQQGTGRVNAATAVTTPVYAVGAVNFGRLVDQAKHDITYTNHSDADLTLALDVVVTDTSGEHLDVGTLSRGTLTVPAGGQATTTLAIDITGLPNRQNLIGGGAVTATGNGVSLRTAVGFGPPLHRITIEVLDSQGDRLGTPRSADRTVHVDHDSYDPARPVGNIDYSFNTRGGIAVGLVPAGIYTLYTVVREHDPDTRRPLRNDLLVEVELSIAADAAITLDAREAVPVQVTVPRQVQQRNHEVSLYHQRASIDPAAVKTLHAGAAIRPSFVTPAPPGKLGFLALSVHWVLAEPQPVHSIPWSGGLCTALPFWCYSEAPAYVYNLPILYDNGIPRNLHEIITKRDLVEVPSRYHSDQPDDVFISHQFEAHPPFAGQVPAQNHRMWIRPGEVTEYFLADDRISWVRVATAEHRPEEAQSGIFPQISSDRFLTADAGSRRAVERWLEGPPRVGVADLREEFLGNPGAGRERGLERPAPASRGGADNNQLIPGYEMMDNTRGHLFSPGGTLPAFATWRMWNLETEEELDGVEYSPLHRVPAFTLAPAKATYQLEQTDEYPVEAGELFRTGPATTTWTFTSRPSHAQLPTGYFCPHPLVDQSLYACQIQPLIQLEYQLNLDTRNQALAGRAHRFSILAGQHSRAVDRAPITVLRVEASFDDGNTWRKGRIIGQPRDSFDTGGSLPSSQPYQQFRVVLVHPPLYRTNGYVSLRVQAEDANGGTVEQVIHRAYILE